MFEREHAKKKKMNTNKFGVFSFSKLSVYQSFSSPNKVGDSRIRTLVDALLMSSGSRGVGEQKSEEAEKKKLGNSPKGACLSKSDALR